MSDKSAISIVLQFVIQGWDAVKNSLSGLIGNVKHAGDTASSSMGKVSQSADDAAQKTKQAGDELAEAFQKLDMPDFRKVKTEIADLQRAYDIIKRSGVASQQEISKAQLQLAVKTRELRESLNGYGAMLDGIKSKWLEIIAVGAAMSGAFRAWAEFQQRMAEVNTLLDVSRDKFAALGQSVLELSGRVPQTAQELAAGLYDLLSSGAQLEDSMQALEAASHAAVAGVTDTKTAIQVGMGVINAYGMQVSELSHVYDVLFQTVNVGVTTFPELAHHIGDVLPTARAAGVGLTEVSAAIAELTKAGIATPKAVTALTSAIRSLAAPSPEAAQKMRELGVSWEGLVKTLAKIKGLGLGFAEMKGIIPDEEGIKAVLALTQNYDGLISTLGKLDNAAGSTEAAYAKMAHTPLNELKLLGNEITKLAIELLNSLSPAISATTKVLHLFVTAIEAIPGWLKTVIGTVAGVAAALAAWQGIIVPIIGFLRGLAAQATLTAGALSLIGKATPWLLGITAAITAVSMVLDAYNKDMQSLSDTTLKHAQNIAKEQDELKRLEQTLLTTKAGTAEHVAAEERLASVLPGVNVELDEQGRLLARVSGAESDNLRLLRERIALLGSQRTDMLAVALDAQVEALNRARQSLIDYSDNLKIWYGFGNQSKGLLQELVLWIGKHTGSYDMAIQKGEQYKQSLSNTNKEYKNLINELAKLSQEEMRAVLNKSSLSQAEKQRISAEVQARRDAIKAAEEQRRKEEELARAKEVLGRAVDALKDKIKEEEKAFEGSIKAMQEGYELQKKYGSEMSKQTAAKQYYESLTQAVKKYYQEQMAGANKAMADVQALANKEKLSSEVVKKYQKDILETKKQVAKAATEALTKALDDALSREKAYKDKVLRLQEEIYDANKSFADKLRDVERARMSDEEAMSDKMRQAAEKVAEAQRLMAQSTDENSADYKHAMELYKEAENIYLDVSKDSASAAKKQKESLADLQAEMASGKIDAQKYAEKLREINSEAKDSGIDHYAEAIAKAKDVHKQYISALTEQENAAIKRWQIEQENVKMLAQSMEDLGVTVQGLSELLDNMATEKEVIIKFNADDSLKQIDKQIKDIETPNPITFMFHEDGLIEITNKYKDLKDKDVEAIFRENGLTQIQQMYNSIRDKHVTIYVHEVVQKRWGGPIIGTVPGGYGGGDRVKAMLEPGEYVIRKEAVKKYGDDLLYAINNLMLSPDAIIPRLDMPAPAVVVMPMAATDAGQQTSIDPPKRFVLEIGDAQLTGISTSQILADFETKLHRRQLCRMRK